MAIVQEDFYCSIIIKVGCSHAMTVERRSDARASVEGDVFEHPVVLVPVKHFALPESAVEAVRINLGIDVAIGQEQVRPSIVVNIYKERSPTQELSIRTQPLDISNIGESTVTVFVIARAHLSNPSPPHNTHPPLAP